MDVKTLIDTAVPTPFGWVIRTQEDFDLNAMLAFQGQLISLSRAFGPAVPVQEPVMANSAIEADANAGVLVPVRAR